jgi:hypothetical protein
LLPLLASIWPEHTSFFNFSEIQTLAIHGEWMVGDVHRLQSPNNPWMASNIARFSWGIVTALTSTPNADDEWLPKWLFRLVVTPQRD